jgi:hypothetical protein
VQFSSSESGVAAGVSATLDKTYSSDDLKYDLGDYLKRPVRISTYSWEVGSQNLFTFNPWELFVKDPAVKKKLDNFNGIRGNLKVKFQMNGLPYYSGLLGISYYPLAPIASQETNSRLRIPLSQRIFTTLDPTNSEGAEITCPYYFVANALSLPEGEADFMGEITMRPFGVLRKVSDAPNSISITIYAWMEDFAYIGSTNSVSILQSESVKAKSEADTKGPVSSVASNVARAAGMLSSVPGIAPYAKATQMGASAVANVAKTMGYSAPTQIQPVDKYYRMTNINMSTSNEAKVSIPLSVDERNEVTIDPTVAGFGRDDEMTIANFCGKESYLGQCTWNVSDPVDKVLVGSSVSPMQYEATNEYCLFTPMAYLSRLFKYWRGSIDFRYVVCSSPFHKGKIKISYDPHPHIIGASDTAAFNTAENLIVDISENKDFTVRVGWCGTVPWAEVNTDASPAFERTTFDAPQQSFVDSESQGVLSLSVANTLSAPVSVAGTDSALTILVFVKAAPDFQLAVPREDVFNLPYMSFGGLEPPTAKQTRLPQNREKKHRKKRDRAPRVALQAESSPLSVAKVGQDDSILHYFGTPIDRNDEMCSIFFGEDISSTRQLIKKYSPYTVTYVDSTNVLYRDQYPLVPGGPDTAAYPLNFPFSVRLTYLAYIAGCFVGYRGSSRYIFNRLTRESPQWFALSLGVKALNTPLPETNALPVNALRGVDLANSILSACPAGNTTIMSLDEQGASVQIPYATRLRFLPGKDLVKTVFDTDMPTVSITSLGVETPTTTPWAIMTHVAAGDDFSCFGFMGVPIMYAVNNPPV